MKENEPISSLLHLIGACLALIGFIILEIYAFISGNIWEIIGFTIFGLSLIFLYLASTLYHFFKHVTARKVFQRIDHAMIYFLIAGTYTPICLLLLRNFLGISILVIVWIVAITGIALKSSGLIIKGRLSLVLYLILGWLSLFLLIPLFNLISLSGIIWLLLGGLFYTIGAVFYSLEGKFMKNKKFSVHEVFHVFVLLGSMCHYWVIVHYLI